MSICVISVPGMGKSTYVKQKNGDGRNGAGSCVDFDYHCPWKAKNVNAQTGNTYAIQGWLDGDCDVFVNPDFINLDALRPDTNVVFLFPRDVDALRKQIEERDGDDVLASQLDAFIESLTKLMEQAKKRFANVSEIHADNVTEAMSQSADHASETDESESETDLTNPDQSQLEEEKDEEILVDDSGVPIEDPGVAETPGKGKEEILGSGD